MNAKDQLSGLYNLIFLKGYSKDESPWESVLAIILFEKMISPFHKDHLKKPIAKSLLVDSSPPMARSTVELIAKLKQKCGKDKATKSAKEDKNS